MEKGFHHADRGYWQTTGEPSPAIRMSYPPGTVEVPLKPGAGFEWDGSVWVPPSAPEPTAEDVYAERDRRTVTGTTLTVTGLGDIPVSGRPSVQADLQAVALSATIAMAGGVTAPSIPFRGEDSITHMLTPAQVIELYTKGSQWVMQVKAAAWGLCDLPSIPLDYVDDSYWPGAAS